ncbi:hypothetical protein Y032_0308g2058 [Ancylostoma ceylanicum]|uniref:Uncharacterized protein n=1 Tax=Ancylostoma ceylanicum TaxID=53326 RepID=A0A016S3R9_9BILA|nr:hypothetical protein Y032_0308g2058 [Ancylostoma ceylanicum]
MKTGQRSMKFSMKRIHGRREAVDATENLGTCLICGYSFCTKCRRTFHGVQQCRNKFDISVSALVENEDGTWGLREVTLQEYLRATPEERIEMGWWYGGIENLENGNADPAGFGYIIGITQGKHFNARAYNRCICVMLMFTQSNLNDACGL